MKLEYSKNFSYEIMRGSLLIKEAIKINRDLRCG